MPCAAVAQVRRLGRVACYGGRGSRRVSRMKEGTVMFKTGPAEGVRECHGHKEFIVRGDAAEAKLFVACHGMATREVERERNMGRKMQRDERKAEQEAMQNAEAACQDTEKVPAKEQVFIGRPCPW